MTLKELKENLDSYIIPLHDSKWAKSKIAEAMTVGYAYPPTEDEIKKAMQPFGKVDTTFSGMKAGTGLGLTIVDSLVTLHGGRFKLISEKVIGKVKLMAARGTVPSWAMNQVSSKLKLIMVNMPTIRVRVIRIS